MTGDMDERFYSLHCSLIRGYVDVWLPWAWSASAVLDLADAIANEENQ
jgi:hypothetical protein